MTSCSFRFRLRCKIILFYSNNKDFIAKKHEKAAENSKFRYLCYMENKEITIAQAQRMVDEWIQTYGVRYFSELTNMAVLTEEVGELARIMSRLYGDQSFKPGENQDPSEEMADILWVLICLANQTGVDLTEALQKSFEKKTARDKERHINNSKLKG